MKGGRVALALAVTLGVASCATVASPAEYGRYRNVRLSTDETERLIQSRAYLQAYPSGFWAPELQGLLADSEVRFYEARAQDRAGLATYLRLYPEGTFAEQARARMAALHVVEQRAAGQAAARAAEDQAEQVRLDALRRGWLRRFSGAWLRMFGTLQGWGQPIATVAQRNPEFSESFGRPPRPRCTQDECVKYYTARYAIAVSGGTRLERTAQLIVRLTLKSGGLARAELILPGWGFSRWFELEKNQLVIDSDPDERNRAVDFALAGLRAMLSELGDVQVEPVGDFEVPAPPALAPGGQLLDPTSDSPRNAVPLPLEVAPAVESVGPAPGLGSDVDLVLPPLQIGTDGMVTVLDGSAPPATSGGQGPKAQITALPQETGAAGAVQRFRVGQFQFTVVVADRLGQTQAYDGVVIEKVAP